ncbi:MAG: CRISPR-associated endonuclease Cas2 [bacterium]
MFIVVSYDVRNDKKRNKIANLMEDYGTRVQYSVFECHLNQKVFDRMVKDVLKYLQIEKDSLRIYKICEDCISRIEVYGVGRVTEDEEVIII